MMLAPTPTHDGEENRDREHRRFRTALIAIDGFAGVTALFGMVILLADWPTSYPAAWLQGTPFDDYTVPALILGLAVGGSALLAMAATLRRASLGPLLALIAGAIMIGWIVGEVLLLDRFIPAASYVAQGVYLLVGLMMVVLALRAAPGGWRGLLPHPPVSTRKDPSPASSPPLV